MRTEMQKSCVWSNTASYKKDWNAYMNKSGWTDFAPFVFMLEPLNIDSGVLFNLSDPTAAAMAGLSLNIMQKHNFTQLFN